MENQNFRSKKIRKPLALLIAVLMVVSLLPISAMAVDFTLSTSDADPETALPTVVNGQVWTDKSVVNKRNGEFEITLSMAGRQFLNSESFEEEDNPPLNVIFVLDMSTSMRGNDVIAMVEGANRAADAIWDKNPGSKVGVVAFANSASLIISPMSKAAAGSVGLNLTTNATSSNNSITTSTYIRRGNSGTTFTGYAATNTIAGLNAAVTELRTLSNSAIILMSDGAPNAPRIDNATNTNNIYGINFGAASADGNADSAYLTILRAQEIVNGGIKIYTIGYNVASNNLAVATLNPSSATINNNAGTTNQQAKVRDLYTMFNEKTYQTLADSSLATGWEGYTTEVRRTEQYVRTLQYRTSTTSSTWTNVASNFTANTIELANLAANPSRVAQSSSLTTRTTDLLTTAETSSTSNNTTYYYFGRNGSTLPMNDGNNVNWSSQSTSSSNAYYRVYTSTVTYTKTVSSWERINTGSAVTSFTSAANIAILNRLNAAEGHFKPYKTTNRVDDYQYTSFYNDPNSPDALLEAFKKTVLELVKAPGDPAGAITITDVLGAGFELTSESVTALESIGVIYNATTKSITWIDTPTWVSPYDVDNPATLAEHYQLGIANVKTLVFTVQAHPTAATTYYTNLDSKVAGNPNQAVFTPTVHKDNTYIWDKASDGSVTQKLTNHGWATYVESALEPIEITVTKIIASNVGAGSGIFTIGLYSDSQLTAQIDSVQINATYVTNGTGKLTIPSSYLNFAGSNDDKTFYIAENASINSDWTDPLASWTPDGTVYTVTVSKDGLVKINGTAGATVGFTNTFDPKGQIIVTKNWGDTPANAIPDEIYFDLYQVGVPEPIVDNGTLTASDNWTTTIDDLDYGSSYYVVESVPADFAAPTYSTDALFLTYGAAADACTITITNEYVTPKGQITVIKAWDYQGDDQSVLPEKVMVYLYEEGNPDSIRSARTVNGVVTFTGLDLGKTYIVAEGDVADYVLLTSEANRTVALSMTERSKTVTLDNEFVPPEYKLTIVKSWNPANSPSIPASVDVILCKDGADYDTITLASSSNWSTTITVNGPGVYSIEEVINSDSQFAVTYDPDPCSVALSRAGNRTGTLQITNTDLNPEGSIEVHKTWAGDNLIADSRPTIEVELFMGGVATGDVKTLTADNDWTASFTSLELGYAYSVEELNVPDGYVAAYSQDVTLTRNGNHTGAIAITNTYGDGIITVNKIWNHGSNVNEADFANVGARIELWQVAYRDIYNDVYNDTYEVDDSGDLVLGDDGNPIVIGSEFSHSEFVETVREDILIGVFNADNQNGSKVFAGLALDATYYVIEDGIQYYATAIQYKDAGDDAVSTLTLDDENAIGVVNVTNTYAEPTGTITVTKQWIGATDPNRPISIDVKLMDGTTEIATITLLSADNWTGTFTNVPINRNYTIVEVTDGLSSNYLPYVVVYASGNNISLTKSNLSGSATIKNEYVTPTGDLTVYKVWASEEAAGENRPTSVFVQLQRRAEGSRYTRNIGDPVEITGESWSHTFENLPLHNNDGATYYYSVVEVAITGYAVRYSANRITLVQNQSVSITVTNRFQRNTGEITVEKVWDESLLALGLTSEVTVALFKDGVRVRHSSRTLNENSNWSATWSRLELGSEYTVVELTASEDWNATYSEAITLTREAQRGTITATNSYIREDLSLNLTKQVEVGTIYMVAGTAVADYTINVANTGNRTLTDVKVYDVFTGIPAGATIVYDASSTSYSFDEDTGVFTIGTLAPGSEAAVRINYSVIFETPGDYLNKAYADGIYKEATVTSEEDDAKVTVLKPDLALRKEVVGAVSQTLTGTSVTFSYKITISNNGSMGIYIGSLEDEMGGAGNKDYTVTTAGVSFDAETNSFIFEDSLFLEPDDSFELTYSVTVYQTGTYPNTATVVGYAAQTEEQLTASGNASVSVSPYIPVVDPDYGTLTVTKQFSGIESVPGNWSATITISGPGGTQSKTITSANRTASFGGLDAGTYTVSETDASGIANYVFVSVDGEGAYNVTVNNTTSVTITNTYSADSNTGDIPEATLEEEGPPLAMLPPDDEDILDDMLPPLSDMPQTGDASSAAPWAFGLFASLMGAGALLGAAVSGKKKGNGVEK